MQPLENWFDLVTLLACCGTAAGAYYWGSVRAQIQQQKHPKAKGSHKARTEEGANFNGPGALLPNTIFQQAINHSAGSLVICDAQQPDLPIVYVSPSFENLTGYEAEEVLGKNCRFLQGDEQQQLGIQEVRKAIAAGTGCKVLLHNYRKTGQPFWNELTLSPIANESGVITHYVGTQVDISHHLETFKALEHSNARYRHLYEETPAMMHSVDRRGRIVSMSHCWLETLGYERGDVIGQPLANFLAQKAPQTIENILLSLESKKVDRNRLCQFVKKRGDRIDVLLSTMAECSENPRSGSTFGVLVDITERRKAKEKLRRSEALLRAINNLPPTGIFVMDCHTNEALFINSEFYRIWQLEHLKDAVEQGEITGEQLLTECLSNIDLGRFVATSTDQDFTHGNKIVEDEVPMLDGRTLRRIYGPIQENDSTFAYLYIFEDITERKQAVQKLALATESAEAANRAKSEFLANMSHELRSPLNAILGFTHILQNDSLTSAQKENLDIIYNSSEHLLALINDILDISKIEARRVVLAHSEFDLYRLIEELQQMFSGVVAQKNLALVVERSPHLPRIIHSDRLKLRQILINLLSNAVKFTATGTIMLSVTAAVDSGAQNHTEYGAS
ncbi:MAG: PAS domain S-box protein, partial [Cyanobacteria bacterium J06560_2]